MMLHTRTSLIFLSFFLTSKGQDISEHIFRGDTAVDNQFPHQVAILFEGNRWCGASLISETMIVTAAHCVDGFPVKNIMTYLGSIDFKSGTPRPALSTIIHSEWNPVQLTNDIALIEIDPINYTDSIKNITLPDISDDSDYEGDAVITSGWGYTNSSQARPDDLQYAEMLVISNDECANAYGRAIPSMNICAASRSGSTFCGGDSGGPLVHENKEILIGITSFMPGWVHCSAPHNGSVFTRVTSFRQWIKDNAGV